MSAFLIDASRRLDRVIRTARYRISFEYRLCVSRHSFLYQVEVSGKASAIRGFALILAETFIAIPASRARLSKNPSGLFESSLTFR